MTKPHESKRSKARVQKPNRLNVLTGTEEIVNRWMNFEKESRRYRHKSACQELTCLESPRDALALIEALYNKIHENWTRYRRTKGPSDKNWQLRRAEVLGKGNLSKEKRLEKNIARLLGEDWFNQIPTASGISTSGALKKASIDLVHRIRPASYELIELKYESNHPVYAAIEILLYGLLYIHARANQLYSLPDHPLLRAEKIGLRVLAPKAYYRDYNLGWFEKTLNDGIGSFVGSRFKIDFKFTAFRACLLEADCEKEVLESAIRSVTPAFS